MDYYRILVAVCNPIFWQVVIHLVFVCSALLAAVTNNIAFSQNKGH
ncbi:hypothetical protein HpCOL14_11310 [Helicobacter pylori]